MWIKRYLRKSITDELIKGQKLVVLFGARQTGKTSLLSSITFNTGVKRYQQIEHFDTTLLSC
jgi:predicted AAA+ superfamily ATPase